MKSKSQSSLHSLFSNRKRIVFFLKIIIGFGLVYYLFLQFKNQQFEISFYKINYLFLTLAIILWLPNIFLQFLKWKITCKKLLDEDKNCIILSSLFAGFSAAIITPFRIGEYAGRNIPFKDKAVFDVTFTTLVDNLCHLAVIFFVGATFSVLFIKQYFNPSVTFIFFLTVSLIILLVCFFYIIHKSQDMNELLQKVKRKNFITRFLEKKAVIDKLHKEVLLKNVALSLLLFVCYNLQFAFLVAAFSDSSAIWNYLVAGTLVMFTKTIIPPVSFGELGIREGASIYFITNLGLSGIIGLYASLSLFFINVLLPAVIGLFFMLRRD
ncbi:MAG: UPF0104 family protein [Ignavibacteriales bacterium]|nr:MAG: UPF0104 family protein [Ignavibacteriales bacterium]